MRERGILIIIVVIVIITIIIVIIIIIFRSNLKKIVAHNEREEQGLETWRMAVTQFADLTEEVPVFVTQFLPPSFGHTVLVSLLISLRRFKHIAILYCLVWVV